MQHKLFKEIIVSLQLFNFTYRLVHLAKINCAKPDSLAANFSNAMISPDTYKNYLRDLIFQLKEDLNSRKPNNAFEEGQKFEMESIIYRIENQAIAFDLDLDEMGFF